MQGAAMPHEMSPYRLMEDEVLTAARLELERLVSQPIFNFAPKSTRESYLQELDRTRLEMERRRA
jgi:hypothetical protein